MDLYCWHVEVEGLPLFELGGLLLVIVLVVVEFISVRSIRTIVTMRRLQQYLKVRHSFKVFQVLQEQTVNTSYFSMYTSL